MKLYIKYIKNKIKDAFQRVVFPEYIYGGLHV